MIWFYWKKSEEVVRLLPERHVLPIRVYEKMQKNDNKNGIWSDYTGSSSYAIVFFRDIYWISLCNSLPNIYLTLNILTSIIRIVILFNIVSIKGNCAGKRLFEDNGYVNRGKLVFVYHFSLSKIYRHQVCLGYSLQPLGRSSTSQTNTMRSTICKYLCQLPSKVVSCHR